MEKTPISIFKNKYKKTDKHPDYKITLKIGDKFMNYGALWIKETKNGEKFMGGFLEKDTYQKKETPREETNEDVPEIKIEDVL
jgi:uncharacterized protein (DUF736 family)